MLYTTWTLSPTTSNPRRFSINWSPIRSIHQARVAPHFANHPDHKARQDCLAAPHKMYGSWRSMAISAGLAVVMLELILRGASMAGSTTSRAPIGLRSRFRGFQPVVAAPVVPGNCRDAGLQRAGAGPGPAVHGHQACTLSVGSGGSAVGSGHQRRGLGR